MNLISACPHDIFAALPFKQLQLQEPRGGCSARAQMIGDWLRAKGFVVGRGWALPVAGRENFHLPLKDINGSPLFTLAEDGNCALPEVCNYHVAPYAKTTCGSSVIFDPVYFNGPVLQQTWQGVFPRNEVEFLALGFFEPPRYGAEGSCYWPSERPEYWPDDFDVAQGHLLAIGRLSKKPSYVVPAYRPFEGQNLRGMLLAPRY